MPITTQSKHKLTAFLLCAWAWGGSASFAQNTDPPADNSALQARTALRQHCQRCHHGEGSEGGDFDVLKLSDLIEQGDRDAALVIAGKPDASYLFERIAKNQMPPRSVKERPSQADKDAIKRWIEAGATAFPTEDVATRKPIDLKDVLSAVRDHLRKADSEQRPYLRYFDLHHLHNNLETPEVELRLHRAALSKALNSLSDSTRITAPQAVDEAQSIFAIDVRDYGWDRGDLWRVLDRAYPYGLKYRNQPDEELRKLDEEIGELTGCDLAILRGDWFVATATKPPLYNHMMRLPRSAVDLERELRVDVLTNFLRPDSRNERIARAGFPQSGVSGQNRMVERHEGAFGAYWKSYDFKLGNARSKLTRFPLGPREFPAAPRTKNPFADQAFAHDGGELIFALRNGLHGYMLVNGKDERIDEGPIEVVSDSLKTSGTPVIVPGLSCFACHKQGMISSFQDTIRNGSAVFGEAERQVKRLYPEQKVMDQLLKRDTELYLRSLGQAIGPFLQVAEDKNKPLEQFEEPIGAVARLYRLSYLDLKTIARELDIADPQEIVRKTGEKRLKQLGLEALLKPEGVVSRPDWEAVDGVSLMQELARELRYTPFQVH